MRAINGNVLNLIMEGIDELGLTKTAVAKHLNMSQQQLNNIINGGSSVPVKYFHKIADILLIDEETLKRAFIEDYAQSLEYAIQDWRK